MKHPKLLFALTALAIGGALMTNAQTDIEATESPPVTATTLTVTDLESFLDRVVPEQLEAHHIPGATVAVVKDGRMLLGKGYGLADLERKIPVVADRTLFRTGSVAKLFTSTAVMQLVEQGKLDLDADVNTYLETFQIPKTFAQAITLRHLLTHTAGFEDSIFGVLARDASGLVPLSEFVPNHIPARVYPPGQVTAYSNFGITLAGHIVEKTAGVRFEDHISTHVFAPLEMTRSTFSQPLPPNLAADVAMGYTYARTGFRPYGFEHYQVVPAGSGSATATDISRFMLAFLHDGELNGQRILKASTVKTMLTRQFSNDARLSGVGLGFYQLPLGGHRVWGHKGETDSFRTLLALLPQQHLGIYAAYNAPGGSAAGHALVAALLERYYPRPPAARLERAVGDLRQLEGLYVPTRRPQTTIQKLSQLLVPLYQPIRLRPLESGVMELSAPSDPAAPKRWLGTASGVLQRDDGKDTAVLKDGLLFLDSVAAKGYQRQGGLEPLFFQWWYPVLCLVGVIIAAVIGRAALPSQASQTGYWLTLATVALALIVALGLAAFVLTGLHSLAYGVVPVLLRAVQLLALLLVLLTLCAGIFAVVPQLGGSGPSRVGLGLTAVASAGWLLWLNHWKVLG